MNGALALGYEIHERLTKAWWPFLQDCDHDVVSNFQDWVEMCTYGLLSPVNARYWRLRMG
jgi:hypothetical protein